LQRTLDEDAHPSRKQQLYTLAIPRLAPKHCERSTAPEGFALSKALHFLETSQNCSAKDPLLASRGRLLALAILSV